MSWLLLAACLMAGLSAFVSLQAGGCPAVTVTHSDKPTPCRAFEGFGFYDQVVKSLGKASAEIFCGTMVERADNMGAAASPSEHLEAALYLLKHEGLESFDDRLGWGMLHDAARDEGCAPAARLLVSYLVLGEVPEALEQLDISKRKAQGWLCQLADEGFDDAKLLLALFSRDEEAIDDLQRRLDYPLAVAELALLRAGTEGCLELASSKAFEEASNDPLAEFQRLVTSGRSW